LGLQTVLFYYYLRIFGASAGLLPSDRDAKKTRNIPTLEQGLVLGIVMTLLGLASSIGAIIYWGENRFGPLDPTISMRLAIPGIVLFSAGIQILFSSFFLSILSTQRK